MRGRFPRPFFFVKQKACLGPICINTVKESKTQPAFRNCAVLQTSLGDLWKVAMLWLAAECAELMQNKAPETVQGLEANLTYLLHRVITSHNAHWPKTTFPH